MNKQQNKINILIGITTGLLIIIIAMGSFIWINYDYIFFKHFISNQYIFTDTLDAIYKENIGIKVESQKDYYRYFDNLAISLISQKINETGNDPFTYQYTPSQYQSYAENKAEKGKTTYTESICEDTVYLSFTNFSKQSMDIFKASIKEIEKYPNIIIDLRDNSGGDLDIAFKLSTYFLKDNDISYIIKYRNKIQTAIIKADGQLTFENITILQNGNTASASEIFINALKENLSNVVTVGGRTYGKGIGQTSYKIKNGYYLKATTFLVLTPTKDTIHNIGIEPDYICKDNECLIDFCMSIPK